MTLLVVANGGRVEPVDDFVEYLYALGLSPKTNRVYQRVVERWIGFCVEERIDAAYPSALQLATYAQTLPMTATSRRQHRVAIRHWLESMGVPSAQVSGIRVPPKKRGVSRALEPDEATALVKVSRGWFPQGTAVLLGLYLALRREEISRVRWDRFSPDLTWYTVLGKRDVTAEIPVHPILADEIRHRQSAHPWLFPGRASAHIASGTVGQWVSKVAERAGVPNLPPHRLRHTAIATVNDETGDLRAAQEFARHADVQTTMIYTRVTAQRLVRAVESLRYVA